MEILKSENSRRGILIKWFSIIIFLIVTLPIISFLPSKVCFDGQCFLVKMAINPSQRARGLMFEQSLDKDRGMLFVYPQSGQYSFWMKNTYIPLDIIWINEDRTVVYINKNTQPCLKDCFNINPLVNAKYVLEVNAGTADLIGLKVGDRLIFKGIKIKNLFVK
ncbi:MAG: DUF192 domain-containing protein [Candidatus Pacebacteria bacterium]|nr:DUF192 domain-containing protein [Candidatus Paceibacterota bacterium]